MNNLHGGDIYSYQNVIDFSANINPLGIPQRAKDAAILSLDSCHHYPDVKQYSLREAIAEKEGIPLKHIICGNGAADLIFSLCLAVKPHKALILAPTFLEYEQALKSVDCEVLHYYLLENNNFELQPDYLEHLSENLDVVFLCNPNNPTGKLIPPPLMLNILELCNKNNILLVVDECFIDFLDDSTHYTLIDYISNSTNLFILKAFTKIYAMPGLRLGYGISSNRALLDKIAQVTQPWNISIPAMEAGITALKESDYVIQTKRIITVERAYLVSALTECGFKTYDSKANYIFFQANESCHDLRTNLLSEGILIRDCSNYIGLKKGYYRIAVKSHEENQILIEKVRKVSEQWQNQ